MTFESFSFSKQQIFLALVLLAWLLCGSQMIMQDDSWWHLRTGEIITESLSVPLVDPFSWALPRGTFWANHSWLAQVLYFNVYRLGSFAAVNLLGAMIVLGTALLLSRAMVGHYNFRAAALLAALPWLVRAFSVRPHLFTLLGIAVFLALATRKRMQTLPLLFFVWAQLHAGVVLGLLFLGVFTATSLLLDRQNFSKWLIALLGSVVAVALNPLGTFLFLYPFAPFKQIQGLPIIEWQPPGLTKPLDIYFWCFAILLAVAATWNWRKSLTFPSAPLLLCSVLAFVPAAEHARHIYVWFLLAVVTLTYVVTPRLPHTTAVRHRSTAATLLVGCSILGCCGWITQTLMHPSPRFGWQPVSASGIKALNQAPMPTFNSYGTGGFVIWFAPERKVFIDSRQDPYPNELLREAMQVQITGNFEAFFERYGIRSAIVERPMPLVEALLAKGWKPSYDGYYFTVLIAPESPSENLSQKIAP